MFDLCLLKVVSISSDPARWSFHLYSCLSCGAKSSAWYTEGLVDSLLEGQACHPCTLLGFATQLWNGTKIAGIACLPKRFPGHLKGKIVKNVKMYGRLNNLYFVRHDLPGQSCKVTCRKEVQATAIHLQIPLGLWACFHLSIESIQINLCDYFWTSLNSAGRCLAVQIFGIFRSEARETSSGAVLGFNLEPLWTLLTERGTLHPAVLCNYVAWELQMLRLSVALCFPEKD